MDLESESSVVESVQDNEAFSTVSASENSVNGEEMNGQSNSVENIEGDNGFSSEVKGKINEAIGAVNSAAMEMNRGASPSPGTKKGYGLKKWRRIKRDTSKGPDNSADVIRMEAMELRSPAVSSSKRTQHGTERSEGSVSSTNAVVRNMEGFHMLGVPSLVMGSAFALGADSDNSEDRSSKSSTAASVPKVKYESSAVGGFVRDKSKVKSPIGRSLGSSGHRGQQGKGRVETAKKARGELVKIEKENSQSSMESDSRSSNFVFLQGNDTATSSSIQNGRSIYYNGENGEEVQGAERQVHDALQGDYSTNNGFYEDVSREGVVADSSWDQVKERSENNGSTDNDALLESIQALQSAKDALEKEVQKFSEIATEEVTIDDLKQDLPSEFTSVDLNLEKISELVQPDDKVQISEDVEREFEDFFRQKIEAEVEYLAIARTVQEFKVSAVDQITVLEDQKDKLKNIECKAVMLKKEAEKVGNAYDEDITSADEILKLQGRVFRYTSYFFVQFVLLIAILGVLMFQLSPDDAGVVPT